MVEEGLSDLDALDKAAKKSAPIFLKWTGRKLKPGGLHPVWMTRS
jgi:hypothetical protein